ncbi:hypothetical protein CBR_g48203 [Chara braunii]|uniref:GIY-YIG domain-containing protein n=1 Tax=Chara braunii TaxID=69332 RepID=A0A388M2F5_CHABU|nr:hypothetical protein CBR_g48203 [Chara braunii]|eukprot:GBG88672.1 hypothetical protein CBR_g48203 [Chara braunii]
MFREIRSYIDESEEDREEVREEAGRLVDAIESRKRTGKKRKFSEVGFEQSTDRANEVRNPKGKGLEAPISKKVGIAPVTTEEEVHDEDFKTPLKGLSAACSNEGMIDYALEVHRRLSAKRVPELRKICSKEVSMEELRECMSARLGKVGQGGRLVHAELENLATRRFLLFAVSGHFPWMKKWLGVLNEEAIATIDTREAGVYIIVSPWCKHMYIGCTARKVITRWAEHVRCVMSGSFGNARKLHAWLRRFGWEKYVILPVCVGLDNPVEVERMLISRFSPALNSIGKKQGGAEKARRKGRRERGKSIRSVDQGTVIVFTLGDQKTVFLIGVIRSLKGLKGPHKVCSAGGSMWSDSWRAVKSKVGATVIEIDGRRRPLKRCRSSLEKGGPFVIRKVWVTSSAIEHRCNYLKEVMAHPYRIKQAYKMSSAKLIALYRSATLFSRKKSRTKLKMKIAKVMRVKYAEDIRKRPLVRIPFSPALKMAMVREVTVKYIEQAIPDLSIRAYVSARVRIVTLKKKTVGEIIHDHRVWAKKDLVVCSCAEYVLPRSQGHVRVRVDEMEQAPRFIHNSRNVCMGRDRIKEVEKGITDAVKPWAKGRNIQLQKDDLHACWVSRPVACTAMSEDRVRHWISTYRDLVLVPVDRTPGATVLLCPVLYSHAMNVTFRWNTGYVVEDLGSAEVLSTSRKEYVDCGLMQVAEWGKNGSISHAYVLPKEKDLDRWRPIAPATTDPARLASARLGKAVRYMLLCLKESTHFDLASTDELRVVLLRCQKKLGKKNDAALARSYDIKDMFAKLSHARVSEAVDWVVRIHEGRGTKSVKVNRRGKDCKLSRTLALEEGYVSLDFKLIKKLLMYDLSHVFVKCGSVILRQVFGIPMGRNSSPALACLVCARAEALFLDSIGNDKHLVRGVRMIDDVSVLVGVHSSDIQSWEKAVKILSKFEKAYDSELKLVRKDNNTNSFEFLGVVIYVSICPIEIKIVPKTRNQKFSSQDERIRVHSLQDFNSFSHKKMKRAVLAANFLRLSRLAYTEEDALAAVVAMVVESNLGEYPPEVSLGSLARFARVAGGNWGALLLTVYPDLERFLT